MSPEKSPEKRELSQKPISELAKYGYRPIESQESFDAISKSMWRWMGGLGIAGASFLVMAVCK